MGKDGQQAAIPDCAKKLEVDGDVSDSDDTKHAKQELEQLMLEQALLQELLDQQELEMKLSKSNDAIAFLDDPVEQQKSYINSTVAASSDLAPSTLLEINMFSWPGLILILPSLPHAICAYILLLPRAVR